MTIQPGSELLHYRMAEKIGEGGMGEVWRARDTTLDRDVAIKILPPAFASDADRLSRFEREAKLLASLNHPNIASIFGLHADAGLRFLAMELVPGTDLSKRLAAGPIPVDEAIAYGRQIAEALESAHERGIVHRDLKPANVTVTKDGTIKVLDFGLAKALAGDGDDEASQPGAASSIATMTSPALTRAGILLGTAAYMSPEQARGRRVDRRADIWAFGCVMYEMLTGRRPFHGETMTDIIAAVVTREPDFGALPAALPASVRRLLVRCLDKNPRTRLRDIGEARVVLESAADESPVGLPERQSSWRERWAVPALCVASLAVAVAAYSWLGTGGSARAGGTPDVVDGIVDIGEVRPQPELGFALSPAGDRLAFVGRDESATTALWVRRLDDPQVARLAGTEGATFPAWSPDGATLVFASAGQLRSIHPASGQLRTLCPTNDRRPEASWSRTGAIVFAHDGVIFRTDATGSVCAPVTSRGEGEGQHADPRFLPDGRRFAFRRVPGYEIRVGDLAEGTHVPWIDEASSLQIVEPDWVMYAPNPITTVTEASPPLLARRFDPATLAFSDEPAVLLPRVFTPGGRAAYAAASNGALVAVVDNTAYEPFVWVTRSGEEVASFAPRATWTAAVSPSGRTVALGGFGLWLQDRGRGVANPIDVSAPGRAITVFPSWSHDERMLAFVAGYPGSPRLMTHSIEDGRTEMVFDSGERQLRSTTWAPGGRSILFWRDLDASVTSQEVWEYSLDTREARAWPGTRTANISEQSIHCQSCLAMAPHRRWLLYSASVDGVTDVYLRRSLETGAALKVSARGGDSAYWSGDGKTIYYLAASGDVMAVDVGEASLGTPRVVLASAFGLKLYGVADDGKLFLRTRGNRWQAQPFRFLLNWPRRVGSLKQGG